MAQNLCQNSDDNSDDLILFSPGSSGSGFIEDLDN